MDEQLRTEFNDGPAPQGEGMEKGHGPVGKQAIQLMARAPDARVLDVGCGSGWRTRPAFGIRNQWQVIASISSDE